MNSLPKSVTRQRHGCYLNPGLLCLSPARYNHSAIEPPTLNVDVIIKGPLNGFLLLLLLLTVTLLCDINNDVCGTTMV